MRIYIYIHFIDSFKCLKSFLMKFQYNQIILIISRNMKILRKINLSLKVVKPLSVSKDNSKPHSVTMDCETFANVLY